MKNINTTDHFLLAQEDVVRSRAASTFELAGLTLAVVAGIAMGALLI